MEVRASAAGVGRLRKISSRISSRRHGTGGDMAGAAGGDMAGAAAGVGSKVGIGRLRVRG